jgi:hypothetical protein
LEDEQMSQLGDKFVMSVVALVTSLLIVFVVVPSNSDSATGINVVSVWAAAGFCVLVSLGMSWIWVARQQPIGMIAKPFYNFFAAMIFLAVLVGVLTESRLQASTISVFIVGITFLIAAKKTRLENT